MVLEQFYKDIKSSHLVKVAGHWATVRNGRIPSWQDIRPSEICSELSIVWAFTYNHSSREFTGRLAGEKVSKAIGRPIKSLRASPSQADVPVPGFFPRALRVVTEPAIFYGVGRMYEHAETVSVGERLILPLATAGRCDGVLGATDFTSVARFTIQNNATNEEFEHWFALPSP